MYDLFLLVLSLAIVHISVAYAAIEIFKLDYTRYLMVSAVSSVMIALVSKVIFVGWKDRVTAALNGEWNDGELLPDVGLMLLTIAVSGFTTAYLVYRRYGISGWAGAMAVNYATTWLV